MRRRRLSQLLLALLIDTGHRRARDLQNGLIRAADQKAGVPHCRDHSDDSAGGDHPIANLQTSYRFL